MKTCKRCGQTKDLSLFFAAPQCKLGVRPECKECTSKHQRAYAQRPEIRKRTKEHRARPEIRAKQNAARVSEQGRASYKARASINPSFVLSFNMYRALKRRPTENPVTHADLMQMYRDQCGLCVLSGLRMTWMRGKITLTSLSIDRINSALGYTKDNVRLVCHGVNRMKGDATDAEMLVLAKAIVSNMEAEAHPETDWPPDSAFMVMQ